MNLSRRLIPTLFLAALGVSGLVAPSTAAGSHHTALSDRWIAFRRYDPEAETKSLWISKIDGSHGHRLFEGVFDFPSWSPDRSKVIFDFPELGGDEQIATVDVAAPHTFTQLTTLPGISEVASYSPDGKHIIFDRYSPDQPSFFTSLWVMNADGSNPHPLLRPTSYTFDVEPKYSPDGSQIAFTRIASVAGQDQKAVYVANADGTRAKQITPYRTDLEYPNWSPDGKWLAYDIYPFDGDPLKAGIRMVRSNGLDRHVVYPNGRFYGLDPDYSPDGTQIMFACFVRAQQQFDLCVMNTDGSGVHRTLRTPDFHEVHPAW